MARSDQPDQWFNFLLEYWDIMISLLVLAITSVLSFFGTLPTKFVPLAILGVLAPFLFNQVRTGKGSKKSLDVLTKNTSDIAQTNRSILSYMGGDREAEVRTIEGAKDFYDSLTGFLKKEETRWVDVTYFSPDPPNMSNTAVRHYWEAAEERLATSDTCIRRIVTVENRAKYEWVRAMITAMSDVENLSVYLLEDTEAQADLLNLCIFDQKSVFLFGPHRPDGVRKYVYLGSPVAGQVFADYFESVWNKLGERRRYLKRGREINTNLLTELESKYGQMTA